MQTVNGTTWCLCLRLGLFARSVEKDDIHCLRCFPRFLVVYVSYSDSDVVCSVFRGEVDVATCVRTVFQRGPQLPAEVSSFDIALGKHEVGLLWHAMSSDTLCM